MPIQVIDLKPYDQFEWKGHFGDNQMRGTDSKTSYVVFEDNQWKSNQIWLFSIGLGAASFVILMYYIIRHFLPHRRV